MKRTFTVLAGSILVLTAITAAAGCIYLRFRADAFSARAQPTRLEAAVADMARRMAVPDAVRRKRNPVTASPAVLREGMAHYADHCAQCHANNGSGQTMLGAGMYPKPPDMRLPETQGKTDGVLFSTIENGIRLSGMPAFSDGSEDESWKLVVFLRHLPVLTAAEEESMRHLNPKGPDELLEEQQEADFLNGAGREPAQPASPAR